MPQATDLPGEWEDPPPKPETYDWKAIADGLRANPMRWRKVFDADRSTIPNAIRQGKIPALHDTGFEVRTSNNTRGSVGPRVCTMFLRFNPDKSKE